MSHYSTVNLFARQAAHNRYEVDEEALERACEYLGIRHRVIVERVGPGRDSKVFASPSNSAHYAGLEWRRPTDPDVDELVHVVRVRGYLPAGGPDAYGQSNSIWHELGHALQRERYGEGWIESYLVHNRRYGYFDNPYEVEAREIAERGHIQLVKEVKA